MIIVVALALYLEFKNKETKIAQAWYSPHHITCSCATQGSKMHPNLMSAPQHQTLRSAQPTASTLLFNDSAPSPVCNRQITSGSAPSPPSPRMKRVSLAFPSPWTVRVESDVSCKICVVKACLEPSGTNICKHHSFAVLALKGFRPS